MPLAAAGFAVVATDYAGLGTAGAHQYLDKIPQANDVVYSIPAARAAVRGLAPKWVAIGYSEGGGAVWGVAELQASLNDSNYAGGISIAGWLSIDEGDGSAAGVTDSASERFWPLWTFGLKASYPSFDVSQMLTAAVNVG